MLNSIAAWVTTANNPNPNPTDPSQFAPTGPNFGPFTGAAPSYVFVLNVILAVSVLIGIFFLVTGGVAYRAGNKHTGQATKGLGRVFTGIVMIAVGILGASIIQVILKVSESAHTSIH